ncbi:MurR/RpiR family transcriptional regulator [Eubacterium oxidoreducens]|uniref:Transcriptional regulator, RpiR family n=1 Tax=Eubacterium oxidoreducens TaxID=1732 RepID=A0A1G6AN84_EUBOX|nr:MurR/RpiR family transcriptional regulator [Eubacterium oxidoreducens]SDB09858.1 transcriptional regulator, RpiR family [Eubacterium oxidoreducens]
MNANNLLTRMNEQYASMSKNQKKLAAYITDNYEQAVFFTAAKMGEVVGVSESTVVRFAMSLGYKGYPQFQKSLEEMVRLKLEKTQKMNITTTRTSKKDVLQKVLASDCDNIKRTLEGLNQSTFDQAVSSILNAEHIYVVGVRACAPLAQFLYFYLQMIFKNVHLVTSSNVTEMFEQMVHLTNKDVVIGISFPRYSMRTLKAMEFANNKSAGVITLTDSVHSPMNLYSSCNLIAKSEMASIVDSMTAPMSVINALIVALTMFRKDEVVKNVEFLEDIWEQYQIYENDEIDHIDDAFKNKYKHIGELK